MRTVTAKDFSPYPGEFLTDELEDKTLQDQLAACPGISGK